MVARGEELPDVGLWAFSLRNPLPVIPIPLDRGHPDALLDLKSAIDRIYDEARYESRIYRIEPKPTLSNPVAEWTRQFVPESFRL